MQERLADMAKRSVTLNQLEDQVTVVNDDLKNLLDHAPRSQVDLILVTLPTLRRQKRLRKICQSITSWPATKSRRI